MLDEDELKQAIDSTANPDEIALELDDEVVVDSSETRPWMTSGYVK